MFALKRLCVLLFVVTVELDTVDPHVDCPSSVRASLFLRLFSPVIRIMWLISMCLTIRDNKA